MWADFHFLRPDWFYALLPLCIVLVWQAKRQFNHSGWQKVVDPHLLQWLSQDIGTAKSPKRWVLFLLAMAGLLAITALAGPVWERQPQPVVRASDARIVVLDLSRSMLATDQKPTRLEQARFKLEDILDRSQEGQTGLIAYAGEPFVISPLTDDSRTISALLPALSPSIMPVQGARADLALQKAAELLNQAGQARGEILLISDGVNTDRTVPVASRLKASGIFVSVLAMGTAQGSPIPSPDGGFMQNQQGEIVIPRLDLNELKAIAEAGGGRFSQASVNTSDIDYLLPDSQPDDLSEQDNSFIDDDRQQTSELWQERGPWLVLFLLPLAALGFRRGWLFSGLLVWCLLPPLMTFSTPSEAAWKDWWKNSAQQTREALDNNEIEKAANLVDELEGQPLLTGESHYRNGDFEGAAESFSAAFEANNSADSAYNLGNALAQLGRTDEAIKAYEDALSLAPEMQDAQSNLELLKQMKEQQEQQGQDGEQGDEGEEGEQGEQNQQDQQNQDGDQSQQQNSDSEQQPGEEGEPGEDEQTAEQAAEEAKRQAEEDAAAAEQEGEETAEDQLSEQELAQQQAEQEPEPQPGEVSEVELTEEEAEKQRAVQQWLRRIPDDPGGLLRNKFRYQYQQRQGQNQNQNQGGADDEDDW